MPGRPKQPKCPHCNRSLYKRMDTGSVKPTDPYAWCRNQKCEHYNQDQDGSSRFAPLGGEKPSKTGKPEKIVLHVTGTKKDEPEAVTKARARIKKVIDASESQFGSSAVGLALALVSQETGNHDAANLLIAEYGLEKKFGIQPR